MLYNYLLHHSESIDSELIEAIIHKFFDITGLSSLTMIIILIILTISIPLSIIIIYFTNFKKNY